MSTLSEKIKEFIRDCSVNWECDNTGHQEFEQHRPKFCRACQAKELFAELSSDSPPPTYAQGQEELKGRAIEALLCKIVRYRETAKEKVRNDAIAECAAAIRALPIKEGNK